MTGLIKVDQSAAALVSHERLLHVLFKVGASEYALGADTVLQMESFGGATPVPGVQPYIAGVVQIRGRVVPVVDLRVRFGDKAAEPTIDTRIVVAQSGERVVGLLVDSAREVVMIPKSEIKPPPPILEHMAQGFVSGVAHVGKRLVLLVDFAKVIGEELVHDD